MGNLKTVRNMHLLQSSLNRFESEIKRGTESLMLYVMMISILRNKVATKYKVELLERLG